MLPILHSGFYNGILQHRLIALDVFRGMIIAFMVLVNTAGTGEHVYPPLRHAEWHGWTLTDVVFPSFVWIVGVAITLGRPPTMARTLRRGAVLFGLGLLVYLYPYFEFSTARILGVLQRMSGTYNHRHRGGVERAGDELRA